MKNFSKICRASIFLNEENNIEEVSYIHLRKLSDEENITKEDWEKILNKYMPEENKSFIPLIIQRLYAPSINNYSSELLAFSSNSVL